METGSQELMVNFVTSSYKPELLKPLVDRISSIPQVVRNENLICFIPTTLNPLIDCPHFFLLCILRLPYLFFWLVKMQVSIMNNINSSVGNTSVGEKEYTLYGKVTIAEVLRGLTFQISANSFFQTNTHQVHGTVNQLDSSYISNNRQNTCGKLKWCALCRLKFYISLLRNVLDLKEMARKSCSIFSVELVP